MGRPTVNRRDVVVLVGTYRPALAAARRLSQSGRRVIVGHSADLENVEASAGVEHSRYVERAWRHPVPWEEPAAFLQSLSELIEGIDEPVFVVPFYEPVGVLLSRRRDELPGNATLVSPAREVVEICIDKEASLVAAEEAGLPSLPWRVVGDHAELVDAVEAIGAVAVRPLNQTRVLERNALLFSGVDEALATLPEWPEGHERLLVQQLARGPRIDIHFAARGGEVLGTVEAIARRMDRPDGTGLGVETMTRPRTPALHEQLGRLVAHLGYTGAGMAQFLLADDGRNGWFLELNPRIAGNLALVQRAGLDLANLAVDLAAGRPVSTPRPLHERRLRSAWTLGDFAGLVRASSPLSDIRLSRRDQLRWLQHLLESAARANVHATWSWSDPLPAVVTWQRYLAGTFLRRLGRLVGRRNGTNAKTTSGRAQLSSTGRPGAADADVQPRPMARWRRRPTARGELVLLVGTYRPAVGAARALARRGRRVIVGVGPDPDNVEGSGGVELSRHVSGVWRHGSFKDAPDAWLDDLAAEVGRHREAVYVLPFYEPVFVRLSRERSRLPPNARFVGPPADVVEACLDKERCLRAAASAGLPSVPHEVVDGWDGLVAAVERIGPVAIRAATPSARLLERKALLVHAPAELATTLGGWPFGHDRLLVQRLIRGPRLNLHFVARSGELIAAVEAVATRTDTIDGTGLTVEARTRPVTARVREQLTSLVGALGFTGPGLAQFMLDDATGEAYLIELNPRFGSVHVIADRAGVDLVNLAVDVTAGLPVEPSPPAPVRAVRSAWTVGDLAGLSRAIGERSLDRRGQAAWLRRLVVSAATADVHATWAWSDPLPAVASLWRLLGRRLRRHAGRSPRRRRAFRR